MTVSFKTKHRELVWKYWWIFSLKCIKKKRAYLIFKEGATLNILIVTLYSDDLGCTNNNEKLIQVFRKDIIKNMK